MRRLISTFIVFISLLYFGLAFAQNGNVQTDDQSDAASGLEARKVSEGVTVLMPKGGRMHRTNELTYVQESTDEYAARNFASVENRLNKLEKENKGLKEDMEDMRSRIKTPEKNAPDADKE